MHTTAGKHADMLHCVLPAALFALVVLYIVAKRSAHFVPTGLLPSLPAFRQAGNNSSSTSLLPAVRGTAWNASVWAGGAAWHTSVWTGRAAWNASVWTAAKLGSLSRKEAKPGGGQQQQQVKLGGGRFGVVPPPPPPPYQAPEAGYDRWAEQASRAHWDGADGDAGRAVRAPGEDGSASSDEWPDPSEPAYEEPVMRWAPCLQLQCLMSAFPGPLLIALLDEQ